MGQALDTLDPFAFLVDDRIQPDRSLAGHSVSNNQHPLPLADRKSHVHNLHARLKNFVQRSPLQHPGRLTEDRVGGRLLNGPQIIQRTPQRIEPPTYKIIPLQES